MTHLITNERWSMDAPTVSLADVREMGHERGIPAFLLKLDPAGNIHDYLNGVVVAEPL